MMRKEVWGEKRGEIVEREEVWGDGKRYSGRRRREVVSGEKERL